MNRDPRAWQRLSRALREARGHKGLTQADLASLAGVSLAAVGAAEKGEPPEKRMPPTLPKIARALGWPAGAIETILEGADPPGGWTEPAARLDAGLVETVMTQAMVTATNQATAAEIRRAVTIAVDELRRHGVLNEPDDVQPNQTM
ncbi:helix-turn-helix transcriptional regulator [Streptomyces sp. DSM 44917]|uniref:Helix-turn-helix transcriptional regulator n=1 Tax=Streptomyces boetiae TaxID=3075541 RepID=A0ABU2L5I4_9ACTN|nr:helix-turn-helix transcriptional regulator [Streptomyces sp. DSM 44917]MDT0306829.1 helix-turn-helix transcriptional regulator [Streptomyces sp. DSM 44917]